MAPIDFISSSQAHTFTADSTLRETRTERHCIRVDCQYSVIDVMHIYGQPPGEELERQNEKSMEGISQESWLSRSSTCKNVLLSPASPECQKRVESNPENSEVMVLFQISDNSKMAPDAYSGTRSRTSITPRLDTKRPRSSSGGRRFDKSVYLTAIYFRQRGLTTMTTSRTISCALRPPNTIA